MLVARVESPSSVAVTMKSVDWPPSTMEPGLTDRASFGPCCRRQWLPYSGLLLLMRPLPRYRNCWAGSGRPGVDKRQQHAVAAEFGVGPCPSPAQTSWLRKSNLPSAHVSCSLWPRRAIVRSVKFRWAGPVRSKLPSSQTNRCVARAAEDDAIEMDLATQPCLHRQEDRSVDQLCMTVGRRGRR